MSVTFANEDLTNDTQLTVPEVDDSLCIVNDSNEILSDYGDVYFDASAATDGSGSQSNPYKTLSSSRLGTNNYFAPGTYTFTSSLSSFSMSSNGMKFIGNNRQSTVIQYTGSGTAISTGSDLTFSGITLKNIHIVSTGGLITATDTIFDGGNAPVEVEADNMAHDNSYGGAIKQSISSSSFDWGSIFGGSTSKPGMSFDNCVFRNNYAAYGGAIYAESGTISITNSKFEDNHAPNYGGAIAGVNKADITVDNCEFSNDYSQYDAGGAIYLFNASKAVVKNSAFNNCIATFGPAIASLNSTVTVTNTNFTKNRASWQGGAVYALYGKLTVTNSDFKSNTARNGGAIFADNLTSFEVNGGLFKENTAEDTAGAIFAYANILNKISNPTYVSNSAGNENNLFEAKSIELNIGSSNYTMMQYKSSYNGNIPVKFDLRTTGGVTPVKDQGQSGNCWAFATIATLESAILKATGTQYILSEGNLKNLAQLYSDIGWAYETNNGGNYPMALGYLTSWAGPVNMSMDPTDDWDVLAPILNSVMHVQNILFLQRTGYTDNNVIKEAIMKYGAVASEIYWSNSYLNGNNYYYSGSEGRNHAISVVGWDDTRSISGAPGTGAWIIKNSYGPTRGDGGYYYVSYYDKSLFRLNDISYNSYAIILNDTVRYNKNYQYDAAFTDYFITGDDTLWYKNIFTSTGNDILSAFSTYFNRVTNWEAKIYINDDLKLTQSGKSSAGYYTIPLSEQLQLSIGDKFTVELKINSRGNAQIPISEPVTLTKDYTKPGVSFFSKDGSSWTDFYNYKATYGSGETGHNYYSQVACIKAFTTEGVKKILNTTIEITSVNSTDIITLVKDQYGALINTGTVRFIIDSVTYSSKVMNGQAILNSYLKPGNHNIYAVYENNSYYNASYDYKSVNLPKENLTLTINNANTDYGEDLTLNVTLTNSIGETVNLPVTVTINGNKYANGDKIQGLTPGKYTIEAEFNGNDDYNPQSITKIINVNKLNSTFNLIVNNITIGDKLLVKAVSHTINTGIVEVKINNKNYEITLNNGEGEIELTDELPAGTYTVYAEFAGNNIYLPSNTTEVFRINKLNPDIHVDSEDTVEGENIKIDVSLPEDITSQITLTIDGRTYTSQPINGQVKFSIGNLTSGNYDYTVTFNGDNKYNPATIKKSVNVLSKEKENITLKTKEYINKNNATIIVTTSTDINTDLKLTISNKTYTNKTVSKQAIFNINSLKDGKYEYTVIFEGNDNYNPASAKGIIEISTEEKHDAVLVVTASDVLEGENITVNVVLPADISSDLILLINGGSYSVKATDGHATFTVDGLKAGSYDYTVVFEGDDNYKTSNKTGSVKVNSKAETVKYDAVLVVSSNDVLEGDSVTVNVVLPADISSDLILLINGKSYSSKTVNGHAIFTVTGLKAGSYDYTVVFDGDDNYKSSNKTGSVKVNSKAETVKYDAVLVVSSDDVLEGDSVTVNVVLPADISSDLILLINGKSYSSKTANGHAIFTVTGLTEGNYDYKVIFKGNDNYNPNNASNTVKVTKKTITTVLYVEDIVTYFGSANPIKITLKDNNGVILSNKNINVNINGNNYHSLTDNEGTAVINISSLNIGEYEITSTFDGDSKYISSNITSKIKIQSTITAHDTKRAYSSGNDFEATLYDANGILLKNKDVSITIDNRINTVKTDQNGKLTLNIPLTVGTHSITVINPVNSEKITKSATIVKRITGNGDLTMDYYDGSSFKVRIYDDNGEIAGAGESVKFTINGKTYNVKTDSNGYATLKITNTPKSYTINVEYKNVKLANKVTVKNILKTKNISKKKAKTVKFTATLKYSNGKILKNKKITFKLKGKTYTAKTNSKGIATVSLKNLKAGKYTIKTTYVKYSVKNTIKIRK